MRRHHAFQSLVLVASFSLSVVAPVLARAAAPAVKLVDKAAPTIDRTHIPDGGPAPRLVLPRPTRFTLSSGAHVLVVERHVLPIVAVGVVWPAGESSVPVAQAGLAGLTADLLDEGTAKHTALQLAEELESLGSTIEAGSGWDSTGVSLNSLVKNLDRSLELLAEVVTSPVFDEKEFERERAERLTAILQQRDSAAQVASNTFTRALYGSAARFGTPAIGSETALRKLTRDDVVRRFASEMRPSNATIIVAGDVTAAAVKAQLERAFAGWKEAGPAPASTPSAPAPAATQYVPGQHLLVERPGAPQSEIRIGEPGVPRSSPDYFPLVVMNNILGGQFSSRLNLNLREQHGYTYGARSDFSFRKQGGPFVVAVAAKTAVTGPSLSESFKELDRIRKEAPTDKEMRLSKDLLERSMARRFETLGDVAGELSAQVVYQLPDDYFATFAQHVEEVTPADALRVAREHLDPAKMAVVVVGDKETVTAQLKSEKLGELKLVDAEGKPAAASAPVAAPVPASLPATAAPGPKKKR